jgi:hypothetical protein
MKLINLIFISACLSAFLPLVAQEADTTAAYYTFELISTGKVTKESDTLYQVIFLMDTTNLHLYSELLVQTSKQKKKLKISKENREDNPRIKIKNKNYHLDMEEWILGEEFIVLAQKPDGSVVELNQHPRASEFYHIVETTGPNTSDLKIYDGPEITEEENER